MKEDICTRYKVLRVAVPSATLAHKEEWIGMTDIVSRWSNILGANKRLANAQSSMLQENKRDTACMSHLCCIAHKTKNAVRTITSNIIETGILSKSVPQTPFGSFNNLSSFTGAVLPTEASK